MCRVQTLSMHGINTCVHRVCQIEFTHGNTAIFAGTQFQLNRTLSENATALSVSFP